MKTYIVKVNDDLVKVKDDLSDMLAIIDALIKDEEEAIAAYQSAISKLPQFKEQLTHILNEEIEHKKELEALKK